MEDPVELLKELIRINTTNPPGAEAALLDCLERTLAKAQLPFARQETAPGRGNLVSRLKADGEITLPPLVLLSHTDVVAADPSQWLHPPFEAWEDEKGFIYGRGAVDTKQLTAMELCAYEALAKTPGRCRDVYFLATCDEESGSTYGLQAFLRERLSVERRFCAPAMSSAKAAAFPSWREKRSSISANPVRRAVARCASP